MDAAIFHLIISGLLTAAISGVSWLVKTLFTRIKDLERDLGDHKVLDAQEFGKLNAQNNEIMRALEDIKHSVERLSDKLDTRST